jgi:hypothetical protein
VNSFFNEFLDNHLSTHTLKGYIMKITKIFKEYEHLPALLLLFLDEEFGEMPQWSHWSTVMKMGYGLFIAEKEREWELKLSQQTQPPTRHPRRVKLIARNNPQVVYLGTAPQSFRYQAVRAGYPLIPPKPAPDDALVEEFVQNFNTPPPPDY